ncbi:MAG: L-fuculose-phosphate aldolase [Tissierellia bacterium]|nr:L-fuculose-phosphate aldolase [Tissierellia bacterium]
MLLEKERIQVAEYGRKLIEMGLTKGTGGNLSVYDRDKNLMAISPSGIDYFLIEPRDVVVMDLEGKVVEGDKKPSSEHAMHSILYKKREDINAVIHTHTIFSTTVACLGIDLPAVHYMLALVGEDVRCAEYASYGTEELARNAYKAMEGRLACLLKNHGLLVGGPSLAYALNATEEVEYVAELFVRTSSMGKPIIIDDKEMANMKERFKTYGQ